MPESSLCSAMTSPLNDQFLRNCSIGPDADPPADDSVVIRLSTPAVTAAPSLRRAPDKECRTRSAPGSRCAPWSASQPCPQSQKAPWQQNTETLPLGGTIRRHQREAILELIHHEQQKRIAGHSLGGAMATLAAAELINADEPFLGLYTFGSPRVGDRSFARIFNVEARDRANRFQNNNDIVTRVPARLMGYSHVGSLVYISADGALSRDPGKWFQFLDRVTGATSQLDAFGIDKIEDHGIGNYMTAISNWGDTPVEEQ